MRGKAHPCPDEGRIRALMRVKRAHAARERDQRDLLLPSEPGIKLRRISNEGRLLLEHVCVHRPGEEPIRVGHVDRKE